MITYRIEAESHYVRVIVWEGNQLRDIWEGVDRKKMLRRLSREYPGAGLAGPTLTLIQGGLIAKPIGGTP